MSDQATKEFTPAPPASAKASQMSIAELGLMVGAADPMMLFPAGTTFTPYSVLRNISDAPMAVTPTLCWMEAGLARSEAFPSLALRPGRSQSLNLMSLISAAGLKNFSGSVNLAFDVQGKEGGLLLAAGSVDQSGTYVFEVVPRGIQEGASKSVGYWSTANGDDTMVTIWNPADEAQGFVFRLIFSGGHYSLPIHLDPRATWNFNISELIANQVPDAEGNIIPASVHEGSATIAGVHADVEHILVAVNAGIYNVRKATCGETCVYCDGYTSFSMVPGSAVFAVQHTQQYQFIGTYSSGTQYNVANGWSSSNTPVATVISSGVATGVSPGSANFITSFSEPVYEGEVCYGGTFNCPVASGNPSGSGNVQPTISGPNTVWWFNGQNPSGYSTSITLTSSGGASTTWAVTSGANEVTLSTTTGASTNVTSSGSAFSSAVGDVQITATASGVASNPFAVTSRKPYRLVAGTTTTACDSTYGYSDMLNYKIQDQLLIFLPNNVPINENWTAAAVQDYSGNNWGWPTAGSTTTNVSAFADHITGRAISGAVPVPVCSGDSTKVQHRNQSWSVGSLTIGVGALVQTDVMGRFRDHGDHESIVSPAP